MEEELNAIVSQALSGMRSHASVPRSVPTAAPRAPPALVTSIRGMVDEVEAGLRSPFVSPGAVRAHDSDVGFGEEKIGRDEEDTVGGMLSAMEREFGGSRGRRRQVRSGEGVYPALGWDGGEGRWGEVGTREVVGMGRGGVGMEGGGVEEEVLEEWREEVEKVVGEVGEKVRDVELLLDGVCGEVEGIPDVGVLEKVVSRVGEGMLRKVRGECVEEARKMVHSASERLFRRLEVVDGLVEEARGAAERGVLDRGLWEESEKQMSLLFPKIALLEDKVQAAMEEAKKAKHEVMGSEAILEKERRRRREAERGLERVLERGEGLRRKIDEVALWEREVEEREQGLVGKEKEVEEKGKEVEEKESEVRRREGRVEEELKHVQQREAELEEMQQAASQLNAKIQRLQAELQEKLEKVHEKEEEVEKRDKEVGKREGEVGRREGEVGRRVEEVGRREEEVGRREEEVVSQSLSPSPSPVPRGRGRGGARGRGGRGRGGRGRGGATTTPYSPSPKPSPLASSPGSRAGDSVLVKELERKVREGKNREEMMQARVKSLQRLVHSLEERVEVAESVAKTLRGDVEEEKAMAKKLAEEKSELRRLWEEEKKKWEEEKRTWEEEKVKEGRKEIERKEVAVVGEMRLEEEKEKEAEKWRREVEVLKHQRDEARATVQRLEAQLKEEDQEVQGPRLSPRIRGSAAAWMRSIDRVTTALTQTADRLKTVE